MAENTAPKAASTIGLKDFVIAPLIEDTAETLTYGAVQKVAGSIEASVTPENADPDVQYADDSEYDVNPLVACAYVQAYAEANGNANVSALTPEVAEAVIKAYTDLKEKTDTSTLTIDELTGLIQKYDDGDHVPDDLSIFALTALITAYDEHEKGATIPDSLAPAVTAKIIGYMNENGVDISKMTEEQVDGTINVLAQVTGLTPEVLQI